MSFGDPNNPYGAPQGQPPGYGHPQQPGQPSYGYPSAPPMQPYGQPAPPVFMPGGVKAARVMLYVLGGFQVLGGVLMMAASAWFADYFEDIASSEPTISAEDADTVASVGAGVMIAIGVIVLAFAFWAIFTAAKFSKGRGGVRVSAIVYASLVTLFSVISLLATNIFALVSLVLGILIIVFCANRNGGYWFNRPQY
ncbi:proline-rich domain-containing protein [Streptomyces sp. NPDC018964]|uniref:proline-rich domain-containing protein n=1 Tax=unclassified Streptomyces TaxID=2593676 RepID=UPI00378C97B8